MDWTRKNGSRLAAIALLLPAIIMMLIFISPINIFVVAAFATLVAVLAGVLAALVLPYIYTYIIGTGVFLFLAMSYLTGFQILNTILLLCFIIGISIIVKK